MATFTIPPQSNKKWAPSYAGEYEGLLTELFNIDLHRKPGKIGIGKKMYPHTTTVERPGIAIPTAYVFANITGSTAGSARHWIAAEKLYLTNVLSSPFIADSTASTTLNLSDSDLTLFGKDSTGCDILLVSSSFRFYWNITATPVCGIARYRNDAPVGLNPGWDPYWWTSTLSTTNYSGLGQPELTQGFPHPMVTFGNAPVLFIGDKNKLHSVNRPGTFANPTTADDVSNSRLVFPADLFINWIEVTRDKVYIGLSELNSIYGSVAEYDPFSETVRVTDFSDGPTMGYVFDNQLYIITTKGYIKTYNSGSLQNVAAFPTAYVDGAGLNLPHRNGITFADEIVYLNVISSLSWMPNGVWAFEPTTKNLYHNESFTFSKSANESFGQFLNTATTSNGFLAKDPAFGSNNLLAGAFILTLGSPVTVNGVFYNGIVNNNSAPADVRGYFITPKIPAPEWNAVWDQLLVKFSPRRLPGGTQTGAITVKYRVEDPSYATYSIKVDGVWQAPQFGFPERFATAQNPTIGDEVQIVAGDGAGQLFTISNVTASGATNIVWVEEPFAGITGGGQFYYYLAPWKKLPVTDVNSPQGYLFSIPEDAFSEWIQFKIEIQDFWDIDELQAGWHHNLLVELPKDESL